MRLIYADALIADMQERYCKPCKERKEDYNEVRCRACWVDDAIGEVDGFADNTIDAVSVEWIPCEERLPKPRESVLLAVNNKYGDWVGEGCYWETTANHVIWKGYRWNATYWDDEIIAWMPLPKPYGEREGE